MSDKRTKAQLAEELLAAQKRIAELEHNELNYQVLAKTLDVSLCRWLPDTTLTFTNEKYKEIFGIQGDALGKQWLDFLPAETRNDTAAYYQNLAENPQVVTYEHPVTIKDGRTRQYQWIDSPIFNKNGLLLEFQSVGIDITELRDAEKSSQAAEQRYQTLFEDAPMMNVASKNINGVPIITECNHMFLNTLGYEKEDVIGKPLESFYTQNSAEKLRKYLQDQDQQLRPATAERELIARDGHIVHTLMNVFAFHDEEKRITGFQASYLDISDRKQADLAMRERERQMQALITSIDDIVFEVTEDGTYINIWVANEEMLMVPRSEVIGKRMIDLFGEEASRPFYKALVRVLAGGPSESVEYSLNVSGVNHWYSARFNPIRSGDGSLKSSSIMVRDITQQKQTEETLKAEQIRFSKVADTIPGVILTFQQKTDGTICIPYASGAFRDVYGLELEDVKNNINPIAERVRQDYIDILMEAVGTSAQILQPWRNEYPYLHPTKGEIWLEGYSMPNKNEDGSITWYGISTDITLRKKSELAMRSLEHKFQTLVEQSPVVVYVDEVGGLWQYLSPQLEKVLGYTVDEFMETPPLWKNSIHPLDQKMVEEEVNKCIKTGQRIKLDYRFMTRDGREIWIHDESDVQPDTETGKIILQGIFYDITDQKLSEETIRLTEQRYRSLFEDSPVMNLLTENRNGIAVITGCNQQFLSTLGYTESEVIGRELADFYSPYSKEQLKNGYPKALSGSTVSEERELVARDGYIIHTLLKASAMAGANDQVIGTQASFIDITERKKAEQALHTSNERFTQMADNSLEVFWMFDNQQGKLIYLNPAFENTWGISIEETLKDNRLYIEAIHPEDRHILFAALEAQGKGQQTDMEYRIIHPDGSIRWIHDRSFPIFDQTGALLRTTGIAADNTERKLAEIALKTSEAKLRSLVSSQTHFVLRTDLSGKFTYWNEKYLKEFGWLHKNKDLHESSLIEAICEYHHSRTYEIVEECLANPGQVFPVELDKPARDGSTRTTLWEFVALADEKNQPTELQCMGIEITDLKQAQKSLLDLNRSLEERVQQRTAEVQDLYDNAPIGYHSLDRYGNIIHVNQTHLDWLGYTREEFLGNPITKFLDTESIKSFEKNFPLFIERGWIRDSEFNMIRKDGSVIPVLISATAIYDDQKNLLMTRTTVFDNTGRRAVEEALRRSRDELHAANQSLERAARLKDEFLASMSHELRTPLTGILGLSETLQLNTYGELNEKQAKTIRAIES
ncbi:MAG: hypothetical protein RL275_730, partial [Chloroflexota bacterium]